MADRRTKSGRSGTTGSKAKRADVRENDEKTTRRTDPADQKRLRPAQANRPARDARRMVAPDPAVDQGVPGQRPEQVPEADSGEERPEATYVRTGELPGSPEGAGLKGRDATAGERETPRQPERQIGPVGGAPEIADPNFAVNHPDVGHTGKAGKTSASLDSLAPARGEAGGRIVNDVMSPAVEVCTAQTELYYVARMMADRDVGAIPVVGNTDDMRPVGILTDRDIVVRGLAKRQDVNALRAGDVMSAGVITVTQRTPLDECLRLMEHHQVRRIVVTDESGRCVGIVAQADVAQHAQDRAAELVREVSKPDGAAEQRRYH